MKKLYLPKINQIEKNNSQPKKKHAFNNPFYSQLRKYKLKRKDLYMPESNTDRGKYLLTEPFKEEKNNFNDTITSLLQKEENQILIKGQKYLIKLYRNDYSSLIDSMKKDVEKSRNILSYKNL